MRVMGILCIILFLCIIFINNHTDSVKINILSNDAAFIKYQNDSNIKEVVFKQPLNNKLSLSISLGDLKINKELERSKIKSKIYVDNERLYMQSNIDRENFTIHSICKFDHDQLAAYTFDRVCCLATLRRGNKTLDKKVCKLEVSATASVCFMQLEIAKKIFDFSSKVEHELSLTSNVFSSNDHKCSTYSLFNNQLTKGLPQKIVVTQGLEVKWMSLDISNAFGELEIGIPVDSIDVHSKTIFPLRIRKIAAISTVTLICSYGQDLSLSSLSFDGTNFGGDFIQSKKQDGMIIKVFLQKTDGNSQLNWSPLLGEHVVNFEMKVSTHADYSSASEQELSRKWISCGVESLQLLNAKNTITKRENVFQPKLVQVKVNVDTFIIIPITTEKTYFAILNEITGPVKLQESDLQMFSVHSVRDGSLVDVTDKTQCQPISNSSVTCPNGVMGKKFRTRLIDPIWKIVLNMKSWQKLVSYPIELWHAVDWRTVIQDKILNRIQNWRYYDSNTQKCRPLYQVTRCQLLARIVRQTAYSGKIYFGQHGPKEFPLYDLTDHLNRSNILISSPHISTILNDNVIVISALSAGISDISIVIENGDIIAVDRIKVDENPVTIADIDVTCIHKLNVTQVNNKFNPTFRGIVVRSQSTRTPKENCYIKVNIIFSDNSVVNIQDFSSSVFKIVLQAPEESITISDLDSFEYQPHKYKSPGKFLISIYEPERCSDHKLICEKHVDLYWSDKQSIDFPKHVLTTTQLPVVIHPDNLSEVIGPKTTTVGFDSNEQKIDTDSLFLSMKILIGLVGLVVLIVILNCVIKIKQRKSVRLLDRPMNHCSTYSPIEKLTTSTYSPLEIINQNPNVQHPPLLPPPGPLYNASDSSQLDLTVNATPDIFWDLPHVSGSMVKKAHNPYASNQVVGYQNMHLQNRKPSPSQTNDLDYGYIISNASKLPVNSYNYPPESSRDSDSVVTGSSGKNCSQIAMNVPPPCAPLRWNNNFCSNQFAMYYPCANTDVNTEPSHHSHANSSQNSLAPSQSSSWEIKQNPVLPPSGFSNSIDNVCEKSSGVGSLTSTKPESDCSKKDSGCPSSPKTTNYSM